MTMLTERGAALAPDPTGARIQVRVIDAGTGSSGIYPAETVEAAAPLVKRGTPIYLDHPTVTEGYERPERSVKDLAGFFETTGVYDKATRSIIAEASILPQWREPIAAMHEHIGMSIRADGEVSEAEGKRVITKLNSIESVDLVTKAGRGGKVLALLESARPTTVAEATHMNQRDRLDEEVRKVHGDANVEDMDDTYVYFRVWSGNDGMGRDTYRQAYTTTDTTVTLTGEKEPVARSTVYEPITTQKEATPVATNTQEAAASNQNPFTKNNTNGGGENAPQDPKDKRIAELEAQVADLKEQLKAAKGSGTNGTGKAKESEDQDTANLEEVAAGEHPGVDLDALTESITKRLTESMGLGSVSGMGGAPTTLAESDPGITDTTAIINALHGAR